MQEFGLEFFKATGLNFIGEISASDILNWMLAFIGGIVIYKIVDNMQTNIERHAIIKDIETTINELFCNPVARSNSDRDGQELDSVSFRTILHDHTPWEKYNSDKIKVLNGQRYINIRSDEKFVEETSTQALHEILITFRRIEKLYKDSILKPIDLADMWREILPFGTGGRIEFFESYFGKNDIKSIAFVVYNTVLACDRFEITCAVDYFRNYYNSHQEIQYVFQENSRYRWREKLRKSKFNKIIRG